MLLALDTATPAVTVALHDGERVVASLTRVDARRHGELLAPAVAAVRRLVETTGAPAVTALTACAAGLRAEADARAAVRTAVTGAAVSARTVSLLPLAGMVLGAVLGAPPWQSLLATGAGRGCLVLGTVLLLLGRWWSRRLVDVARRAGT